MTQRDNDTIFIRRLVQNTQTAINVSQLCRVTKIVGDGSKVDVQPMALNYADDSKRGLLLNVHVGRLLRKEIKVGDVVVVLFLDRSQENWDGSNRDFVLTSKRMHNVNDAFVVEVY